MGTFFIVNPAAGRGRARQVWHRIRPYLGPWGPWDMAETTGPGSAMDLARTAARAGFARVVALGGDGTVGEVLNGLMGTGAALAVVPAGTGNDFIRTVRIPRDPLAAAHLAMTATARLLDVGELRTAGRSVYFLNVAGTGFDAEVARATNRYPKYLGGTLPYLAGILRTLWSYRPVPLSIDADGRCLDRRCLLVAVANARYYGGGMMIAPDAQPDDGLFDVCIAGDVPPGEILRLVPRIYRGGHQSHPRVEFVRCRELHIRAGAPVAVHADGEVVGELPATFCLHPGAIRCITGDAPP